MAFCKVCLCGEKIVFETRMSFPLSCPVCGRWTAEYITYREDDPAAEALLHPEQGRTEAEDAPPAEMPEAEASGPALYVLRMADGGLIPIPEEGGVVGRDGLGAGLLENCLSVSREHLRVTPRPGLGVIIEDISRFGTRLNGKPLAAGTPELAMVHARVTLCNVELTLEVKED